MGRAKNISADREASQSVVRNVQALAFSPDNKLLAVGTGDLHVNLWNIAEGKIESQLRTLDGGIRSVRFLAGGKKLLAGTQGSLWLHDVATADAIDYFSVPNSAALPLPDDRHFIAYGFEGILRIWDMAADAALFESKPFKGYGGPLACATDGSCCALGTQKAVHILNIESPQKASQRHLLKGHKKDVRALAFSPRGDVLASAGKDAKILFWNVRSGEQIGAIELAKRQEAWSIVYLNAGKTLACVSEELGGTGKLTLTDTSRYQIIDEKDIPLPLCVAASSVGQIAVGDQLGKVQFWSIS